MPVTELYIGIMSGTSVDCADIALADFSGSQPCQLGSAHIAFNRNLQEEFLILSDDKTNNELGRAAKAGIALAKIYSDAVHLVIQQTKISAKKIIAIGCHGQTIRHRPEHGFSIQLGAAPLLAELPGITVVADFRNRDIAAGGQSALPCSRFSLRSIFFSKRESGHC